MKPISSGKLDFKLGFVAGAGIVLVLASALGPNPTWLVGNQLPSAVAQATSGPSFAAVARRVEGAVANINTEQVVSTARDPFSWFFGDEWPFGQQTPRSRTQQSLGSGFIVDPSGYVLTNIMWSNVRRASG